MAPSLRTSTVTRSPGLTTQLDLVPNWQLDDAFRLGVGLHWIQRGATRHAYVNATDAVRIAQDPACPMCATREIRDLVDYDAFCAGPRPRDEVSSLSPSDAVARMGDGIQLIDVREPWEWEICHLPGATLLPLGQLGARLRELDASRETIVYCHRGMRSLDAARRLLSAGFSNVAHITGGIDRFSLEVDESLARY